MKKKYLLFILTFFSFVLVLANISFATTLDWGWGTNITIQDGVKSDDDDWFTGVNKGLEDQEVEPGATIGQNWDLEGFFLNSDGFLTMVGGYDFINGEDMYDQTGKITSGDIFIDVDGYYGEKGTGNYGYEYVLDIDWTNTSLSYNVYDISSGATLQDVIIDTHKTSNPWQYNSTDNSSITSKYNGTVSYQTNISDADSGFLGAGTDWVWSDDGGYVQKDLAHNAVGVDLSFLSDDELANFTAHFTMECGNDNLMGAVPEPSTLILLGLGLLGLSAVSRKKIHKS